MLSVKPIDKSKSTFQIPGSKSYSNRFLILAAQNKNPVSIRGDFSPLDVQELILALKRIGLDIVESKDGLIVKNSFPDCEQDSIVEVQSGEGGTTNRFLLPLLSLGQSQYKVYPSGRILHRPFDDLMAAINSLNGVARIESDHFYIQGPIAKNTIDLDCSKTTQTATGFKLIGIDSKKTNFNSSKAYWDLTVSIHPDQLEYEVVGDWSSACFAIVIGLVSHDILIKDLKMDSLQADSKILEIIDHSGSRYEFSDKGLHVYCNKSKLNGFEFDCSNCIDAVPAIIVLACFCNGPTQLTGIQNLVYKECDRKSEIENVLKKFSVNYEIADDSIKIFGTGSIKKLNQLQTFPDHRIVMMSYLLLALSGGGELANTASINKSYPGFLDNF